jgi:hypothetical protein
MGGGSSLSCGLALQPFVPRVASSQLWAAPTPTRPAPSHGLTQRARGTQVRGVPQHALQVLRDRACRAPVRRGESATFGEAVLALCCANDMRPPPHRQVVARYDPDGTGFVGFAAVARRVLGPEYQVGGNRTVILLTPLLFISGIPDSIGQKMTVRNDSMTNCMAPHQAPTSGIDPIVLRERTPSARGGVTWH